MSPPFRLILFCFVSIMAVAPLFGQPGGGLWQDVDEQAMAKTMSASAGGVPVHRDIVPRVYRTVQLDRAGLANLLASAVPESTGPIEVTGRELQIPLPSGGFGRFSIQESSIMESKLAARYPEIKTYVGKGLDDPTATMRIDVTPRGFHAIILSAGGQIFIDPYTRETATNYISYFKHDFVADKSFPCLVQAPSAGTAKTTSALQDSATSSRPTGATLKSYRLAVAATGEYASAVCAPNAPTVANTLAALVTSINRCSAVYERELAIRFVLVNTDDKIIYLDGNTDPYTNSSATALIDQNQSTLDSVIGSANYDFGHVFSTGAGGYSLIGVICSAGAKAKGASGVVTPVGDPFDIDYVCHEMGHQFGAHHCFNGTAFNCAGSNRNASTAYEPGGGTTIMGYAGICSPQDLATNSDDYFNTISYDEITNSPSGGCAQSTSTGNTPPTIAAVPTRIVPMQTPFALTASGTDPNGDTLTYCWEEFDLGPAQDPTVSPRDNGSSPIFRSFAPSTNPTRNFPSLTYILNNANVPPATLNGYATGEFLPTTNRTMNYRVTVRDNRAGGGGSNYASTTVTSVSNAGPFVITAPNLAATLVAGSQQTVTWNVANTTSSPVSCASVNISLSTDGGYTFPTVLASNVPNNGSAVVTIPSVETTQGRIKVGAVGNIFFDVSDANLTITSTAPPVFTNGPPPSPVTVGTPYTFTFTATGNPAPSFSVTNGVLPPGLSLSSGGTLSGTATTANMGTFPNITVTASNGNLPNAQETFSLTTVTRAANYLGSYGLFGGNAVLYFDYDRDGITNLMEYALNLNPTVSQSVGLPVVKIKNYNGSNYLSMAFTRSAAATDLTYTVQGTVDMLTWTDLATSVAGGAMSGPGFVTETGPAPFFTVEVRDTVPINGTPGAKRFLRLRVSSP